MLKPALYLEFAIFAMLKHAPFRFASQPLSHHQGHEHCGTKILVHPGESFRGNPDDCEFHAIEPYVTADNRPVRTQLFLPEIVSKDDDSVAAGHMVFLRPEASSQPRLHAHRL